jgi:Pin2-interacting protein X1
MEKMGWQSGKGLGVNENGMTEHIKVKFKMDTKGIIEHN